MIGGRTMIKVIITKKEETEREKIQKAIERDGDITVAGFANSIHQAFILCNRLAPDVILIDLFIPGNNCFFEAIKLFRRKYPVIKIIMLASLWDADPIISALADGVDGCLCKDICREKLAPGIKSVVNGLNVVDKEMYRFVLATFAVFNKKQAVGGARNHCHHELSGKQLEILGWLAEGLKEKAVAHEVGLSINTVKYHKKQIFDKLEAVCTNEALVKATRMNLIWSRTREMADTC
jgi:DNA-binding NarL/FixJ family response regulator